MTDKDKRKIPEFELDEIVLKISECFHAPMADDGMSAVEGDGNKIKDILITLLQRQPERPKISREEIESLVTICLQLIPYSSEDIRRAYYIFITDWLKSKGYDVPK